MTYRNIMGTPYYRKEKALREVELNVAPINLIRLMTIILDRNYTIRMGWSSRGNAGD